MQFAELAEYRAALERTLRADYAAERRRVPKVFRPYVAALEEFTLRGGKRLRALLVLAGYHLATGRDPRPVLPAAAAFEHFQSWMLVHDDIIDHSETRRNGPTLHRLFAAQLPAEAGPAVASDYGVGLGITLGDLEEPFTVAALLAVRVSAERRLAALAEYTRMTRATAYGQALDIRNARQPIDRVTEADVLAVHRYKTAFYTVASPIRLGAMLGGARTGLLDDLEAFGVDIGIAFQLRDDVLGTGFDADAAGKSANDLIEGKRTLLVVRAWATADSAGRGALEAVLGRPAATAAEVDAARAVIRSTGSLEYSERRIEALARRAYGRVARSRNLTPAGKSLLGEIGERLIRRAS